MIKVQILKQMQAGDTVLKSGDIVDATGWRHIKALEGNRYIKVLSETVEKTPVVKEVDTEEKPKPKAKSATKE